MLYLTSRIPNHASLRNIIFDFGGVICDLDIARSIAKFREFGPPRPEIPGDAAEHDRQFGLLVSDYETGRLSSAQFRESIRNHYTSAPSDEAIDTAWNALLVGIPEPRIRMLEEIRNSYRIFLLSNSNEIHYLRYRQDFENQYGYADFDTLFEKTYFSYRLKLRKPDPAIFSFVLKENNLPPAETLFIDDTLVHVTAARQIGMSGYHLDGGEDVTLLFE